MKQTFKVLNVKCGGCANTLKSKLKDKFGDVEVNLDVMPREISLDISKDKIELLKQELIKLGYPMANQKLNFAQNISTKAKSFVSCAIGKMDLESK
jgi:copper chaperone CopZ